MPYLATFLGNFFVSLVSFFSVYITKRVAIILAVVTAAVALTASFITAMSALIAGIVLATPESFNIACSWFVPDNAVLCFSSYLGALVTRWVYDWNTKILQYKLF